MGIRRMPFSNLKCTIRQMLRIYLMDGIRRISFSNLKCTIRQMLRIYLMDGIRRISSGIKKRPGK